MVAGRVTLTDVSTRALQMRRHVQAVAESILTDHRADALFAQVLAAHRHVHGYSSRNRMLMAWQAPLSRLVASLAAYDRIAAEQGTEPITIRGRRQRVMIRGGAKAVWIWGRQVRRTVLHDALTDEDRTESTVQYLPVTTWAVEDVVYAASGEAFVLPDHVQPIHDLALYDALIAFAAHKQIDVVHTGIIGARGVSSGGRITLQHGDPQALQLPVLAHEIMHELLHHGPRDADRPRHLTEGEAQAGAAVLLRMYGHEEPLSAGYLRNHSVKPAEVLASMDRIIRAVDEVVGFVQTREVAA